MAEKLSREKLISATYAEIQKCDQNGEFERALKAANRSKLNLFTLISNLFIHCYLVLHMEPQEQLAFHCKIVCLVQLGKFEEALQQMRKHPNLSGFIIYKLFICFYVLFFFIF